MNTKYRLLVSANAALYLTTCALAGTGLLLELRMDDEDGAVRLFGMGRDDWGEIHIAVAIGFLALTALHLLSNLAWVRAAAARAWWAAPMLTLGLGIVSILLFWPLQESLP
jgi:hypothetical protein